jgi:O-glycosyl hydrolase
LIMFEKATKLIRSKKTYYLLKVVSKKFDAKKYQFGQTENRYGTSMINDFNNGTVGWTDWNILLDQNGGPNHVGNFVCTYSCRYHSWELILYTLVLLYWAFQNSFDQMLKESAQR